MQEIKNVVIGGITLAVIVYLLMVYQFLYLVFVLGAHVIRNASVASVYSQSSFDGSANALVPQVPTSNESTIEY